MFFKGKEMRSYVFLKSTSHAMTNLSLQFLSERAIPVLFWKILMWRQSSAPSLLSGWLKAQVRLSAMGEAADPEHHAHSPLHASCDPPVQ